VRFWDSSALVVLHVPQRATRRARDLYAEDPQVLAWVARAKRLLAVHALRAADALQIGAALAAAYDDPVGWEFVCLDERLAEAARREGFAVVP
jgi:predicted nucleic acid-binding protein